jgi:hypothetical protein
MKKPLVAIFFTIIVVLAYQKVPLFQVQALNGYGKVKLITLTSINFNATLYQVGRIKVIKGTGTDGVNITNGFDVNVYVGDSIQDDFDDVRFTEADGETPCPQFRQELVVGSYAVYWFKTNVTAGQDKTIYMYYNNSFADYSGQAENVFFDVRGPAFGSPKTSIAYFGTGNSFISYPHSAYQGPSYHWKTVRISFRSFYAGTNLQVKFYSGIASGNYFHRKYVSGVITYNSSSQQDFNFFDPNLMLEGNAGEYFDSLTPLTNGVHLLQTTGSSGDKLYYATGDIPICQNSPYTASDSYAQFALQVAVRQYFSPDLAVSVGDVPTNMAPTIGEFQASAVAYANKYFLFNATVNDGDGVSDLLNATVQLSNSIVLKWMNITDAFSIDYDPNGYCTLDASGCSKTVLNDTALKLTWKIKLGWAYPEGFVSVIATNTKVFDNSGASGSGSYANLFVFEDDLIVYSASCSETDNRTGCGQPLTFNGTIYYEGTTTPPESFSGVTAHVGIGESARGSTTIFSTDGSFSITVQAESTVGFYIYTVYATTDEATIENQTFGIIVDKLSITVTPSKLKANLNEQVTISWTIKRAYDDSVCSDFVINLQRDGQLWAENLTNSTITDVSSLTTQHVYTVSSALDNTYGLTAYDALSATVSWGSLIPSTPPTIRLDIQPINLGEVQATATVNFTITATFDMPRITITKIEFQAESTWFKILTSLPRTYDKELNAWGTATIDAQLTLPATATGTYTIPFIIYVTLPDGTKTQANSYITLTAKTSTLKFTTETFIETIKRLLGNPIILILLIALIVWLSAYSLKNH